MNLIYVIPFLNTFFPPKYTGFSQRNFFVVATKLLSRFPIANREEMFVSSSLLGRILIQSLRVLTHAFEEVMVVQSARIESLQCFRGNSILFPSAGGSKHFQTE